jgi:hypothetical protein
MFGMFPWHESFDGADDDRGMPMTARPDQIHVVVAGGAGRHSSWIPTLAGNGFCVTKAIAGTGGGAKGHRERQLEHIATLLDPMADVLRADGYDLRVGWAPHAQLHVEVTAGPDACSDCLVPSRQFRAMVVERLANDGQEMAAAQVRISYPPH